MNETPVAATQTRIYEDDLARLDAVVTSLRFENPGANRPYAIRRLLDAYEAAQATAGDLRK